MVRCPVSKFMVTHLRKRSINYSSNFSLRTFELSLLLMITFFKQYTPISNWHMPAIQF